MPISPRNAIGCQGFQQDRSKSRREFLKIGALGMGGLSLPGLLRAEQTLGIKNSHKAVIMIYMVGAPPHQDMYDLKMDAPVGIRGEFKPTSTAVPGIQICEHLPKLASIMDKVVPLRSVHGSPSGDHDSFICYTGRSVQNQPPGGWPSIGSNISRLLGSVNKSVPPFFGLSPNAGHPPYGSPGHPGYLGVAHAAVRPAGPVKKDMLKNSINGFHLSDRKSLLTSFDQMRRENDAHGRTDSLDAATRQSMDILTSNRLVDALDLSREPTRVRERFGKGDANSYGDGAPRNMEHFLTARRLVEAGARVVTLNFGRWDFHSSNFSECKNTHFPLFDHGMHALITDLHERGLDERLKSTRTLVGTIGLRSAGALLPGEDSEPGKSSGPPTESVLRSPSAPFILARSTPPFTTILASTTGMLPCQITLVVPTIWWTIGNRCPN